MALGDFFSVEKGQPYEAELVGESGPQLLGMGVFRPEGGFRHHKPRRYTGAVSGSGRVVPGDVLVATTDMGANVKILGRPAELPKSIGEYAVATGDVGRVVWRTSNVRARAFAYWAMRTDEFRKYCLRIAQGTAVRRIRAKDIESFSVLNPERPGVDAVVALLEALETKIDLNRRTNQTLERLAGTLFKSWFVDLDPFEVLGHSLPPGWREVALKDVVSEAGGEIQTGPFGSQLHASDYVESGVPVIMPTNIRDRRVELDGIARVPSHDVERLSKHKVRVGDLIYSRRGDVEKHAIISEVEEGWLCGTGCLLVRPGRSFGIGLSSHFLSLWLDQPVSRAWIAARAVGATMPNLNTGILGQVPILVPSASVLEAFDQVIAPLDARVAQFRAEARTLSSLRALLLGRLLLDDPRITQVFDGEV